jgi:hypothetical protein
MPMMIQFWECIPLAGASGYDEGASAKKMYVKIVANLLFHPTVISSTEQIP